MGARGHGTGQRSGVQPSAGRPKARRRPTGWLAAAIGVVSLLAAACGSAGSSVSSVSSVGSVSGSDNIKGTVVVFAAASLNGAFDKLGSKFEKAHPGVNVKFNYAGSSSLATQLKEAAPADLFASANTQNMNLVTDDNLAKGQPKIFARNKLEIMVAPGNPKHIKSVSDLANSSIKVAVCAPAVPCGSYSDQIFKKAGVTVHPVSEETSVSGVVTKVSLGEADAGVVYVTDVKEAGNKVTGVPIPADQNVIADYPIAALKDAPNPDAASAFMNYVLSQTGRNVLTSYGFMLPSGS
jgi:molybdate transport system substrate-binding protein